MKYVALIAALVALSLIGSPPVGAATKPAPKRWHLGDDYPAKALRAHHEGTTYITVTVDKAGKPRDCVVTKSSGFDDLDEATCNVFLKGVRFTPATDDNGTPVDAPFSSQMNWRIPG